MQLDDFQQQALDHKGNLLLCTGRQVGKTTILAMKACERMIEKPTKILIGSLTEDQAKLIIAMCLNYLEKNYKTWLKVKKKDKPTLNKIILTNGSQILARPVGNDGAALRGFTGDVFIMDELSRWPELALVAGMPTLLTTGGEIWGASTPYGKQGFFWEAFQNKENFWKVIHVSSEDVIKNRPITDSWTEKQRVGAIKFLEQQKSQMSALQYAQEYLGMFVDDLQRLFSEELIEDICTLKPAEPYPDGVYYAGHDLARMGGDQFTAEIIEKRRDKLRHCENFATKNLLTTKNEELILSFAKKWRPKKIGIDAGAGTLGVSVLDHLLQSDLRTKIIPLNNRAIAMDSDGKKTQRLLKEDMYLHLLQLMEKQQIHLLNDEEVKLSLRSVQYEFPKEETKYTRMRIFGNYTHIVEGIIRAVWLAKEDKGLKLWVRASRGGRPLFR